MCFIKNTRIMKKIQKFLIKNIKKPIDQFHFCLSYIDNVALTIQFTISVMNLILEWLQKYNYLALKDVKKMDW